MAKRKMLFHPDYVREKIRASQLINRLQNHALGLLKPELTTSQVRSIEILLRKCVPDLAAAEIKSEQTHRYVVEIPPLLSDEEWQEKYSSSSIPLIDLKMIRP
jgi:hypothetical protein